MKERPVLFSAPMVRALLEGSKTQTRRVVKPQPPADWDRNCWYSAPVWGWTRNEVPSAEWHKVRCPYGQLGDRLYVKESYRLSSDFDADRASRVADRCIDAGYKKPWAPIQYEADGGQQNWDNTCTPGKLRPSIFMPRWASRITLAITSVRVERLKDISEADAQAEGVGEAGIETGCVLETSAPVEVGSYLAAYADLWESINGPGSWDANPWVWVVSFRRLP